MSKTVLISIQPYWVFLIIAKAMGWNIDKEKTVEVRKTFPKDEGWNEVAKIYCSKNKKSFAKIPKEYQPLMKPLLGKVIGEFVCDEIQTIHKDDFSAYGIYDCSDDDVIASCMQEGLLWDYGQGKDLYFWHISNLKIYDKPKELSEFRLYNVRAYYDEELKLPMPTHEITRPPQSWCYIEDMEVRKYA